MLTSKLRAEYIEMINQVLDQLQVDEPHEMQTIQNDLQHILNPTEEFFYSEKYHESMRFIEGYLHTPEDYVEHRQDDDAFRQIIRERIEAKITEFRSLNLEEKRQYIAWQQARRSETTEYQRRLRASTPPASGSERHVLTEHQWLAQMQQHFQHETFLLGLAFFLRRLMGIGTDSPSHLDFGLAIHEGIITHEQYTQIPPHERESMQYLFSPNGRDAVAQGIITLEQYLQIPLIERESLQHLFSPQGRAVVTQGLITLEQYLEIPLFQRELMLFSLIHHPRIHI